MASSGNPSSSATYGYFIILLLTLVARGEDPSKEGTKGTQSIFVQAADLSAGVPVEARFNGLIAVDPDTSVWRKIAGPEVVGGAISPDGHWLVSTRRGKEVQLLGTWLYDLRGDLPPRPIFDGKGVPFWSDGGKHIIIGTASGTGKFVTWRVNADGTDLARLPLPDTDFHTDCSRDGTWLLGSSLGASGASRGRIVLVHPDGTGMHTVVEGRNSMTFATISPDGQSVAYVEDAFQVRAKASLWLVNANGVSRRKVPLDFDPAVRVRVCWSPDGSRLAMGLWNVGANQNALADQIAMVDTDGKNYQVLALPPWRLTLVDWK
jgi:hypothetical protein